LHCFILIENDLKKKFSVSNITSLISKGTEITGDIHFSGALEIEGRVFGNIFADEDSTAEVRVRETGFVKGDIQVPLVIINGLIEGNVFSSNHIELAAKARVAGNICYNLIEMVMGSEINGVLCHKSSSEIIQKQLATENNVINRVDTNNNLHLRKTINGVEELIPI
jgi:cytoskeletal protein CcmA (bactofilin family)